MKANVILIAALISGCLPTLGSADERPFVDPPREAVEARQRNELMSKEIQIQSRQQRAGGDPGAVRELRRSFGAAERAQERMRAAPGESYPYARDRSEEKLQELDRKTIGR